MSYREGEFVEPVNDAIRAVRGPGQILMVAPLPTGQELTVQPFNGDVMWAMPCDSVRRIARPNEGQDARP